MVTVDGKPLDTRYDLEQFTDLGFGTDRRLPGR